MLGRVYKEVTYQVPITYFKNQRQTFSGHKEPDAFSEKLKAFKKGLRIAREERDTFF